MNFFEAQDRARRNTKRLVLFFLLAVCSLIVLINLLVMLVFGVLETNQGPITLERIVIQFDWHIFAATSGLVLFVIIGGSAYKTLALSGGGVAVAEAMGGRLIPQTTTDLYERKTLNVVEEMAIASGMPVPPVYLLDDEPGINAFAAGFRLGDAVIGVTRGTITYLSREELQGVIAHEFSHILHGDMRLNIRLMGILHGILLIGLIGYVILRSARGGGSKNAAPMIGLGIGLLVIGFAGSFFGDLIKASVSRQREFLADASAVQFTRSNLGIATALKKIGGYVPGSALNSPEAPSLSHAFFSAGVTSFMQSIFATHPPLTRRIKALDPSWDGVFAPVTQAVTESVEPASSVAASIPSSTAASVATAEAEASTPSRQSTLAGALIASQVPGQVPGQVLERAGTSSQEQLAYAQSLLSEIPMPIRDAVHAPYGARAVVYGLLIDRHTAVQDKQLDRLAAFGDFGIEQEVRKLLGAIQLLDIKYRLPLIDMALPALGQLSGSQYQVFKKNLLFLIQADEHTSLFEWSLQQIVLRHLEARFGQPGKRRTRSGSLKTVTQEIEMLLSALIYHCVSDKAEVNAVLVCAEQHLKMTPLKLLPEQAVRFESLEAAVERLALLPPLHKQKVLHAGLAVITHDADYSPGEMEFIRAIAAMLDCPLPPGSVMVYEEHADATHADAEKV